MTETVANFLRRELIARYSLTQEDLANAAHMSRVTVSQLMQDRKVITVDIAVKLEKLTGRPATEWLAIQIANDIDHSRIKLDKVLEEIVPLD